MRPINFQMPLMLLLLSCFLVYAQGSPSDSVNENTYKKMMVFQQQTQEIVAETRQINRKMEPQFAQVMRILKKTQDARAALRSSGIADMQTDLNRLLALSQQYLNHYRSFIQSIDQSSTCYKPENFRDFEEILKDTRKVAAIIPQLVSEQGKSESFDALSGVMMLQANANILVNYFETFKMCYIADSAGSLASSFNVLSQMLGDNVKEAEKDRTKALWFENLAAVAEHEGNLQPEFHDDSTIEQPKGKQNVTHNISIRFYADDLPELTDLFEFGIDELDQLYQLSMPEGLQFNEIHRLIYTPKYKTDLQRPLNGTIKGTLLSYGKPVVVNIKLQRMPAALISEYKWYDPQLEKCVKSQSLKYLHQIDNLNCKFAAGDTVELFDLSALLNINRIEFSGGEFSSLTHLNQLSKLKEVGISNAVIDDFSGITAQLDALKLLNIYSDSWPAIENIQATEVSILQPENCAPLALLIDSDKVTFLYPDMGEEELMDALSQHGKPVIQTDCEW